MAVVRVQSKYHSYRTVLQVVRGVETTAPRVIKLSSMELHESK